MHVLPFSLVEMIGIGQFSGIPLHMVCKNSQFFLMNFPDFPVLLKYKVYHDFIVNKNALPSLEPAKQHRL